METHWRGGDDVYAQYVNNAYTASWDLSTANAGSDSAVIRVSVTIARDGKVLSSSVVGLSGDAEVNKTVQRTLDHVTFIKPFGESAKDEQRTYKINFHFNAKQN